MSRLAPYAALALILPLAACATAVDDVRGPRLTAIDYHSQPPPKPTSLAAGPRNAANQPASANSLWQTGARAFFNDQRASQVGDILTVQISIDDSAKTTNATDRSKASAINAGVNNLAGFEANLSKVLPGSPDLSKLYNTGSTSTSNGTGTINRAEKINLTIAAVVTGVLPNGNLVIEGRQEVRTNADVRDLTVAGIVRPQDISASNTINHTQIAEARISYGGRGDIARIQKAPAGQSLVERFSPF